MAPVEEADELYAVPPDEFVSARTALAKRLREEGRRDDAAEVGGLRKPPLALWAVNELARRHGEGVRALLGAADRLRRGEDRADDELRRALADLVRAAGELLEGAGHAASDATLQRVSATLHGAAAAGGDEAAALGRGALPRELEPGGFEAMAAFAGAAPRRKARPPDTGRKTGARRRARVEAAEAALADARSRERELRREAEQAARAAERARRDADRAAAEVEKAEKALVRARGR